MEVKLLDGVEVKQKAVVWMVTCKPCNCSSWAWSFTSTENPEPLNDAVDALDSE